MLHLPATTEIICQYNQYDQYNLSNTTNDTNTMSNTKHNRDSSIYTEGRNDTDINNTDNDNTITNTGSSNQYIDRKRHSDFSSCQAMYKNDNSSAEMQCEIEEIIERKIEGKGEDKVEKPIAGQIIQAVATGENVVEKTEEIFVGIKASAVRTVISKGSSVETIREDSSVGTITGYTILSQYHINFQENPVFFKSLISTARRSLTIISLEPAATECLCAILSTKNPLFPNLSSHLDNLNNILVGVSEFCNYPEQVLLIPKVTMSMITGSTSVEVEKQITELHEKNRKELQSINQDFLLYKHPGIILTQDSFGRCGMTDSIINYKNSTSNTKKNLQNNAGSTGINPSCTMSTRPLTVQDMLDSILHLGEAIGESSRAQALYESLSLRLDKVSELLSTTSSISTISTASISNTISTNNTISSISTINTMNDSTNRTNTINSTNTINDIITPMPTVIGLESLFPLVASGQWLPDMRVRSGGKAMFPCFAVFFFLSDFFSFALLLLPFILIFFHWILFSIYTST